MVEPGKLIFSPQVAKYLLQKGHKIIDIKPDRINPDKTIFVFRYADNLSDCIFQYKKEKPN